MVRMLKILVLLLGFYLIYLVYGTFVYKKKSSQRFPEELRMEVYYQVTESAERAKIDSKDSDNRKEARDLYLQAYEEEIADEYGLTLDELEEIEMEGFAKEWRLPD